MWKKTIAILMVLVIGVTLFGVTYAQATTAEGAQQATVTSSFTPVSQATAN